MHTARSKCEDSTGYTRCIHPRDLWICSPLCCCVSLNCCRPPPCRMRLLASIMDSADIVKKHTYRKCTLGHVMSRPWHKFASPLLKVLQDTNKNSSENLILLPPGRFFQHPVRRCWSAAMPKASSVSCAESSLKSPRKCTWTLHTHTHTTHAHTHTCAYTYARCYTRVYLDNIRTSFFHAFELLWDEYYQKKLEFDPTMRWRYTNHHRVRD